MKNITVHFVLDASGSMEDIKSSVISGFNEYLHSLQKDKHATYNFSLTQFDSRGLVQTYVHVPIAKVEDLTNKNYIPGQMTPLYDSVVNSIIDTEAKVKKEPVVFAVMTDGLENASKEHTEKTLQSHIKRLTDKGNWTFVFLGANQDSWATAQKWGIPAGNIANWKADPKGTKVAFAMMAMSNANFSQDAAVRGIDSTANYFNKGGES